MTDYKITHLIPAPANTFAVTSYCDGSGCWLETLVSFAAVTADGGLPPRVLGVNAYGLMHEDDCVDTMFVAGDDLAPSGKTWSAIAKASKGKRGVGSVEIQYSDAGIEKRSKKKAS